MLPGKNRIVIDCREIFYQQRFDGYVIFQFFPAIYLIFVIYPLHVPLGVSLPFPQHKGYNDRYQCNDDQSNQGIFFSQYVGFIIIGSHIIIRFYNCFTGSILSKKNLNVKPFTRPQAAASVNPQMKLNQTPEGQ